MVIHLYTRLEVTKSYRLWDTIFKNRVIHRKKLKMFDRPKGKKKVNIQQWRSWHLASSLHGKQTGKKWKQWQILFSWSPNHCGWWLQLKIKRYLLLGRKAMTNLDSFLKSRNITLPTNFHIVKAMIFPTVMHGCECWTIKKVDRWKIDAFELWCWRRLLRVP